MTYIIKNYKKNNGADEANVEGIYSIPVECDKKIEGVKGKWSHFPLVMGEDSEFYAREFIGAFNFGKSR